MSDLFADVMSASAASSASDAARQARAARNAAEEKLDGTGHNPFISFTLKGLEQVGGGFLGYGAKNKLTDLNRKLSIKKTDISHFSQDTDDFQNVYTTVHLEQRCNLEETEVYVAGTIEEVSKYVNGQ